MTDASVTWNDERVEQLKKLWAEGKSASQIATEIGGISRNAVIGKVHRLGLAGRPKAGAAAGGRGRTNSGEAGSGDAANGENKSSEGRAGSRNGNPGGVGASTDPAPSAGGGPAGRDAAGAGKGDAGTAALSGARRADASAKGAGGSTAGRSESQGHADSAAYATKPANGARRGGNVEALPEFEQRVTIMELREGMCRWPIGDPTSPEFRFCGARADIGSPYCDHHARIAYQPAADRRRERKVANG